jgi:uncharacterized protein YndB with AHSA1/START domain
MEAQVLRIEKRINADRARLFRAWLDVRDFARWFIAGEGVSIESVNIDPRVGGAFRIDMSLNGELIPHEGVYVTIDEPSRLVFTWRSPKTGDRETLVTITFDPVASTDANMPGGVAAKPATLITLVHERLVDETERANHTRGWTSILEGLSRVVHG